MTKTCTFVHLRPLICLKLSYSTLFQGLLYNRCLLAHHCFQSLSALRSLSYGSHCFQGILFGWIVLAISRIGASKRATNLNLLDT